MIKQEDLYPLAGEVTLAKGKAIADKGHVNLQISNANQIKGIVSGTHDYHVGVTVEGEGYWFSCTCPAFEYQEVCKHCVALVLASHSSKDSVSPGTKTESAANNELTPEALLKSYIASLPVDTLKDQLYQLLNNDEQLFDRWLNKAQMVNQTVDIKSLKKQVTKALPLKDIWEYHQANQYFDNALDYLSDILDVAVQLQPEHHIELVMQIYARMVQVIERVDDSGGYSFLVLEALSEALIEAFARQHWSATEKARWLEQQLTNQYYGFPAIPTDFNLNDSDMNAFLAIVQTRFDDYPVSQDLSSRKYEHELNQLGDILLAHCNKAAAFSYALKIKAKLVCGMQSALQLSQFCLDHDDELLAEDWLIKAKSLNNSSYDQSLWNKQAIPIYNKLGEDDKAWQFAWQNFEQHPSYAAWLNLKDDIEFFGWNQAVAKQDAKALLEERAELAKSGKKFYHNTDIIDWYLAEDNLENAIYWLDCDCTQKSAYVKAAPKLASQHPIKSIEYTGKVLEEILSYASNEAYSEATLLLRTVHTKLCKSDASQQAFANLIKQIARSNSRRPNMMKRLGQYFSAML